MDVFDDGYYLEPSPDSGEPSKKFQAVLRKQDHFLVLQTICQYSVDTLSSLTLEQTCSKLQGHTCSDARVFSVWIKVTENYKATPAVMQEHLACGLKPMSYILSLPF